MEKQRLTGVLFFVGLFYSTLSLTIQAIIIRNTRNDGDWGYEWQIYIQLTNIIISFLFAYIIYLEVKRFNSSLFSNDFDQDFLKEILNYYIVLISGYLVFTIILLFISVIKDESAAQDLGNDIISFYGIFDIGRISFLIDKPLKVIVGNILGGTNRILFPLLVLVTSNIIIHGSPRKSDLYKKDLRFND